ncbi:MAG: G5 domain-containing protein [Eubacteriales bacterium]
MSNRKTPNTENKSRRYSGASSRSSLFTDEKVSFIDKVKKIIKLKDNTDEKITKVKRRNFKSENKSRGLVQDDEHAKELQKRRKTNYIKKYIIIGASFAAVVILVLTITLVQKNRNAETTLEDDNAKNITIYLNNEEKLSIKTYANTIGEMLAENNIAVADNQKISCDYGDEAVDNMEIFISEPLNVSVLQNGIKYTVTLYGGTVEDALNLLEVDIDEYDIISPSKTALVKNEMVIQFTDVEIKQIVEIEKIPFDTEEGETKTVESGYFAIGNEGKEGSAEITYEVKYINNEEVSREEISRTIIEEPVTKVILWGTAARSSSSSSSSSSSDSSSDNSDDSSSSSSSVPNPDDQVTNPSIPSKPTEYIKTMTGHVTAYTHTGGRTATGTWPRSTRTLSNPGTCAVVPGTIPYGSLLYVTGYGYCIAEDTGGFRNDPDRWNQIDLFMNTRDECIQWGRRTSVTVYIIREGY